MLTPYHTVISAKMKLLHYACVLKTTQRDLQACIVLSNDDERNASVQGIICYFRTEMYINTLYIQTLPREKYATDSRNGN